MDTFEPAAVVVSPGRWALCIDLHGHHLWLARHSLHGLVGRLLELPPPDDPGRVGHVAPNPVRTLLVQHLVLTRRRDLHAAGMVWAAPGGRAAQVILGATIARLAGFGSTGNGS